MFLCQSKFCLTHDQEHVSEYGVHWNFFLTLALLPVLQVILHPVIRRFSITALGVGLGIGSYLDSLSEFRMLSHAVHQLLLSYAHLQAYVLHAPRVSWISANKEGIVSLTGLYGVVLPCGN